MKFIALQSDSCSKPDFVSSSNLATSKSEVQLTQKLAIKEIEISKKYPNYSAKFICFCLKKPRTFRTVAFATRII